jgi:hypothetical protein
MSSNAEDKKVEIAEEVRQGSRPTIESLQKDIEFGNKYRLELLKHLLTLSAAILAFTISFRPTLIRVEHPYLMWIGWIALGLSSSLGMLHMLLWSHFYLSYRDFDWYGRGEDGKKRRKTITLWRRLIMFFQFFGFGLGVLGIALFAAFNFQNVPLPK